MEVQKPGENVDSPEKVGLEDTTGRFRKPRRFHEKGYIPSLSKQIDQEGEACEGHGRTAHSCKDPGSLFGRVEIGEARVKKRDKQDGWDNEGVVSDWD